MDGRDDPPSSRAGRMSLAKQFSFTTGAEEAEGGAELHDPLTSKFNLCVYVKSLAYFSTKYPRTLLAHGDIARASPFFAI